LRSRISIGLTGVFPPLISNVLLMKSRPCPHIPFDFFFLDLGVALCTPVLVCLSPLGGPRLALVRSFRRSPFFEWRSSVFGAQSERGGMWWVVLLSTLSLAGVFCFVFCVEEAEQFPSFPGSFILDDTPQGRPDAIPRVRSLVPSFVFLSMWKRS